MSERLRIGVLGAARITPLALLSPAKAVPEVRVAAVSARDRARAEKLAHKHGIPHVFGSYDEMLQSSDIDAVYNPLPNGLHSRFTIKALEAGKHVLCEKPLAANAADAEAMRDAAKRTGRVLQEAAHWRHHPLAQRIVGIVKGGELGKITRIETAMCIPFPEPSNIRYRLDLAGGALMDVGFYATHMFRAVSQSEPRVLAARVKLASKDVDRFAEADVEFDGGTGRIRCSLWSWHMFDISMRVVGERGELRAFNPIAPQFPHSLKVKLDGKTRKEKVPGEPTYTLQLRAFAASCLRGAPVLTDADDAVKNQRVVDAIYAAAGLPLREPGK